MLNECKPKDHFKWHLGPARGADLKSVILTQSSAVLLISATYQNVQLCHTHVQFIIFITIHFCSMHLKCLNTCSKRSYVA